MAHSWNYVNRHLFGVDPAKELDWCRREHLEYSTPARLAHYIVCWKNLPADDSNEPPEEHSGVLDEYRRMPLPKPSDPVERWRELHEWRHPQIDLNLLQLAVIFHVPYCITYLNQPIFTRTENYRDEKSVLVNYPLHLACRLGRSGILYMINWNRPDELFSEEGIVDLSQAKIQRLPSPENQEILNVVDPSAKGTPTSSTGSFGVANENELLALMRRNDVTIDDISLGLTPTVGTCFSLTAEDDDSCVAILFIDPLVKLRRQGQHPQSSTVEYLWKTVGNMCRRGMSVECFANLIRILGHDVREYRKIIDSNRQYPDTRQEEEFDWETHCSEITMLACQLAACVAENTGSYAKSLKALCDLFVAMIDVSAVESVQRAASYLPRKYLPGIVRILKRRRRRNRVNSSSFRDTHLALALNMLTNMAKETNLENICVLKVLECVRGDARAARSLTVLPEPLRELFHVPFQVHYDQFTAGNEA